MEKTKLRTARLSIVPVDISDLNNVHELHSLKETDEFNTLGIPENIKATQILLNTWISSKDYIFSVYLKESRQFVGLIALVPGKPNFKVAEVWYKTLPSSWNKGYTSEALNEILNFGFHDLKLHRIEAGCATANARSIKVLEKAGMVLEGTKRKVLPIRGEWVDSHSYAILDTEFQAPIRN